MNPREPNHIALCQLENVVKHFPMNRGLIFKQQASAVHAVNGVSLTIERGETLGLVGESGCGKTTLGRITLGLISPTSGTVRFKGMDLHGEQKERFALVQGKLGAIFQDPFSSLDPRMSVYQIVAEPLRVHRAARGQDVRERVLELLSLVGLSADQMARYPHEFSGGQRQRIAVARALALNPELIVADEPSSALDVSIQAQIINLLQELQENLKLAYLLISHDLNLVYHISHRIAVMYLGKIVELARAEDLYRRPMHPYTRALISAVPSIDFESRKDRILLRGGVQSPTSLPSGCIFSERCFMVDEDCKASEPDLADRGDRHYVACLKVS